MTEDVPHQRGLVRLGHPSRLSSETREVTLLGLGHLVVFFLSMAHDEIVEEMVDRGWVIANFAERSELLFGLVLFFCWSALTLRLFHIVREAQSAARKDERS